MTVPTARRRTHRGPALALSTVLAAGLLTAGAAYASGSDEPATTTSIPSASSVPTAAALVAPAAVAVATAAPDRKQRTSRAVVRASASPYKFASTNFNRWYAKRFMKVRYDWKRAQFRCLAPLWGKESAWNERAHNGGSGAHGIPQAMPGSKMASFGRDWRTNPMTQIKWGLSYIKGVYSSPCRAWAHWRSRHWY